MTFRIDDTPPAHGEPLLVAILKAQPGDFVVKELLEIDFDNSGEHLYLQVQKTSLNTDELVGLIEKAYAVGSADVGVAGLKDRHAVTTQWLSVCTPDSESIFEDAIRDFNASQNDKHLSMVASARHSKKLRRGAHSSNHFEITLRDVHGPTKMLLNAAGDGNETGNETGNEMGHGIEYETGSTAQPVDESLLTQRMKQIRSFGFPNYIGPQRFGFGGQNLIRARQWLRQPKKRASRQQRSLWLSAGRSAVFNSICAARVRDNSWTSLRSGEPAVLNGTRSFFLPDEADDKQLLKDRLLQFDIHPSAPWWGRGRPEAQGDCRDYEQSLLEPYVDLCAGLERAGLKQERRALRAQANELEHHWIDKTTLRLSFHLSPGVFATTLLREIAEVREPDRRSTKI